MSWSLEFDPYLSWTVLALGALAVVIVLSACAWRKLGGTLWRGIAFTVLFLLLAKPSLVEQERDPLTDVAVVVVDRSESQNLEGRTQTTQLALDTLKDKLDAFPRVETRIVDASPRANAYGTRVFASVDQALNDVSRARLAGIILLTDGQIHDAPTIPQLDYTAPVHGLITGSPTGIDRKLTIVNAPKFGIVGEQFDLTVRVDEYGLPSATAQFASLRIAIDGEQKFARRIFVGQDTTLSLDLTHGGENVIEVEVDPLEGELTLTNNRAVVLTNGIRDRLRVLLVSGEPHAGERVWRNLLKSDPSVDLVHFTILRPPEKQDGTPIGELSLIAFPTRELFSVKLYEFDLIIFDRYRRRGVLPLIYLDNIARFVENGGAILTAAGPAFATPFSLYRSPLAAVLPAQPTGDVLTSAFQPQITDLGRRHPVTVELDANWSEQDLNEESLSWGRWFRLIDSDKVSGNVLMSGTENKPLLVLDRFGEGRVAQLMSDHAWLWARGYEGGGPQAELLRRVAHWLMKEPDLEEEVLKGAVEGENITITRRTMQDTVEPVTVEQPDGSEETVDLINIEPGIWQGQADGKALGLYRLTDGEHSAVVARGALNPLEYADVRATQEILEPISKETGGGVFWLRDGSEIAPTLPGIRLLNARRDLVGRDWIGLKKNNQFVVRSLREIPLISIPLALFLLLGSLLWGWYREGQ